MYTIKENKQEEHKSYVCDFPNCCRVFKRNDHLKRHKKNHDPSKRIPCSWPGCNLSFVRSDVKEKHYKRHLQNKSSVNNFNKDDGDIIGDNNNNGDNSFNTQVVKNNEYYNIDTFSNKQTLILNKDPQVIKIGEKSLFNLIDCFLNENIVHSDFSLFESDFHDFADIAAKINLNTSGTILYPPPTRNQINEILLNKMINLIPTLKYNPDFKIPQIERFLEIYWFTYHPQYPILHRPTFSVENVNPLLLLAMIMIGAGLCYCTLSNEILTFINPHKLAEEIAEPLRWIIFSNSECKTSAKTYIIQSLLLLESFEITSTNRLLHERSFLYHGTKIQLLRRSPMLGKARIEISNSKWERWIESESIKRACFMAFYLDILHATVFGHNILLYSRQIKLSLPCDDSLWECGNLEILINELSKRNTPNYINSLKKLLNNEEINVSGFGKNILFAGLLSIMFELQQKLVHFSSFEGSSIIYSWLEVILLAIDRWRENNISNFCCGTIIFSKSSVLQNKLPPMLKADDTRCKFSLYYMVQIYARIKHSDFIIYAGAPNRTDIQVENSGFEYVRDRINRWSNSPCGRICVIHTYLYLCEMLLSPINEDIVYSYNPNSDPYLYQKNILVCSILVIFAYNFSLEGPESNEGIKTSEFFLEKEDGYTYLKRIRNALSKGPGGPFHSNSNYSTNSFTESMKKHAEFLPMIKEKNNLVGLLRIFYNSFMNSNWQLGREYSRLFRHCIRRCLGSKNIICEDMYEDGL